MIYTKIWANQTYSFKFAAVPESNVYKPIRHHHVSPDTNLCFVNGKISIVVSTNKFSVVMERARGCGPGCRVLTAETKDKLSQDTQTPSKS